MFHKDHKRLTAGLAMLWLFAGLDVGDDESFEGFLCQMGLKKTFLISVTFMGIIFVLDSKIFRSHVPNNFRWYTEMVRVWKYL